MSAPSDYFIVAHCMACLSQPENRELVELQEKLYNGAGKMKASDQLIIKARMAEIMRFLVVRKHSRHMRYGIGTEMEDEEDSKN